MVQVQEVVRLVDAGQLGEEGVLDRKWTRSAPARSTVPSETRSAKRGRSTGPLRQALANRP